jgi:hypothetical protein
MTLNLFTRRLHLYLGMFLLPWFFLYGLSSIPFSHPRYFQELYNDGVPLWSELFERPYELPIPLDSDLRVIGRRILDDNQLGGAFGASRPKPGEISLYVYDFRSAKRVVYLPEEKRIRAEKRRFRWDHFMTGFHARGGFGLGSWLHDAWAVVVDIVCVGFLLWIASGVYMWWLLPRQRFWGFLALGGGAGLFVMFLMTL